MFIRLLYDPSPAPFPTCSEGENTILNEPFLTKGEGSEK